MQCLLQRSLRGAVYKHVFSLLRCYRWFSLVVCSYCWLEVEYQKVLGEDPLHPVVVLVLYTTYVIWMWSLLSWRGTLWPTEHARWRRIQRDCTLSVCIWTDSMSTIKLSYDWHFVKICIQPGVSIAEWWVNYTGDDLLMMVQIVEYLIEYILIKADNTFTTVLTPT